MKISTKQKYALIGAGPAGLSGAKNLKEAGIPFDAFEAHSDVGGLWNIDNENSTIYESAHLISSKFRTAFDYFPMKKGTAIYPSHQEICNYFKDYARHFDLYEHYRFDTRVKHLEKVDEGWELTTEAGDANTYKGVIIANGNLSNPNIPTFKGDFEGEMFHSCKYKSPTIFKDKKVLIIGAGNSGCDIAVDAVHYAKDVHISMRRGYYFIPKFVFGKPVDTIGGKIQMPPSIKQKIEANLLKMFIGNPADYGFPKPDHKLYESHPIVNSLILHYAGHGDVKVRADIQEFEGETVHFKDGNHENYDIIVLATGYKLHYPFIDEKHLNWQDCKPNFYMNIFHPHYNNLFLLGLVEAAGIGWQGRDEQAQLIRQFILAKDQQLSQAQKFALRKRDEKNYPDLQGGFNYLKIERMSYYVHNETYRKELRKHIEMLS